MFFYVLSAWFFLFCGMASAQGSSVMPPGSDIGASSPKVSEKSVFNRCAEKIKGLFYSTLEKTRSWRLKSVRQLLFKKVEINPRSPEGLMNSCHALVKENQKERALDACQSVVYAVSVGTVGNMAGYEILGAEASFESYKLLNALGRQEEAGETLLWAVKNAPASWPRLSEARKYLKKYGLK